MPLTVEAIQDGYTNLNDDQPADGSGVEVVIFSFPRRELRNYYIYKGTSIASSPQHIQLTITTINQVEDLRELPARNVNLVSTLSTTHDSSQHIYWRPYTPTIADPAALQKDAKGPMSPTITDKGAEELEGKAKPRLISAEPAARTLVFGGKRRKSRKTKRKSRRKK